MTCVDAHVADLAARCSSTAKLSNLPKVYSSVDTSLIRLLYNARCPLSGKLVLPLVELVWHSRDPLSIAHDILHPLRY